MKTAIKESEQMIGCLIIHGYTGGPHEVEPLAEFLRKETDWHIEVPTLPGHGKKLDLNDVSYKDWIDSAEEALQKMQEWCQKMYLVGFSMGGMIAAYLAGKYHIDKLVLLAPSRKYLSFKQIAADVSDVLGDGIKGNLGQNEMYNHYKKKFHAVPVKANIEFMKLVNYTRPYLKKVKTPVFIAQGQQDQMVPYRTPIYLDKEIQSERKEIILFERSRHLLCHGEDKDILNQMVYRFLSQSGEKNRPVMEKA
jgi:carboxylesterase